MDNKNLDNLCADVAFYLFMVMLGSVELNLKPELYEQVLRQSIIDVMEGGEPYNRGDLMMRLNRLQEEQGLGKHSQSDADDDG